MSKYSSGRFEFFQALVELISFLIVRVAVIQVQSHTHSEGEHQFVPLEEGTTHIRIEDAEEV
jgi:hypothetical protein